MCRSTTDWGTFETIATVHSSGGDFGASHRTPIYGQWMPVGHREVPIKSWLEENAWPSKWSNFFRLLILTPRVIPPPVIQKLWWIVCFFLGNFFLPGGILVLVPGTVSSSIFQTFGSKAHAAANYHRHPGHPQKAAGRCWPTSTKWLVGLAVWKTCWISEDSDFSPGFIEAVGQCFFGGAGEYWSKSVLEEFLLQGGAPQL